MRGNLKDTILLKIHLLFTYKERERNQNYNENVSSGIVEDQLARILPGL